jgi:predicted amidohydrolase
MMARKARQHRMYVVGGIYRQDSKRGLIYNTALLFDRQGHLAGHYDKIHPFTHEFWGKGSVTPGRAAPVFRTDFGTVGIMICYDSWFTDVAELLALKGAEIILFPNAGYYVSLMPARSADNGVRLVVSSLSSPLGIWDTAGRDIMRPRRDPTTCANCPPSATARDIRHLKVGKVKIMLATLDLSQSPSPHNWGGPMLSAPGGRRNRREQTYFLYDEIRRETERWWKVP